MKEQTEVTATLCAHSGAEKVSRQQLALVPTPPSTHSFKPNGVIPEVGMGVTICMWTDRKAGTIIRLTASQIHVQRDLAKRIDSNGVSEQQEYSYKVDPEGIVEVFRKTKRGWRNKAGNGLSIGHRSAYYDYSFCNLRLTLECGHSRLTRSTRSNFDVEKKLANPELWISTPAYCDQCREIRLVKVIARI